jgi:hypothetical protein
LDWLESTLQDPGTVFQVNQTNIQFKHVVYQLYTIFCERADQKYKDVKGTNAFWRQLRSTISISEAGRKTSVTGPNRQVNVPSLCDARNMFMAAVKEESWEWD